MSTAQQEVASGQRFAFGRNWSRFLSVLDDGRVATAVASLREMLRVDDLKGKSFLDIGSGSGLFSLSARKLGARVHSFDFDQDSVSCAEQLREKYFPDRSDWTIEQGSILDRPFVASKGRYDVVYSWGVLHHTGKMWEALDNAGEMVAQDGQLFIAIYNDQGWRSRGWTRVKKIYCSGFLGRAAMCAFYVPYFTFKTAVVSLIIGKNRFAEQKFRRGMSVIHDWVDWIGGYPFEVAKPEEIFEFYRRRGFRLENLKTTPGLGNNQFVFRRVEAQTTGSPDSCAE